MSGLPRHLLVPFNFESKWESLDVWNRGEARQGKRKARWDEIVLPQSSSREKANTMSVHSPAGFLMDRTCGDALENENLIKVTLHTKMLHSPRNPRLFLSGLGSGLGLRRIPYPPIKPCLSMMSIPMNKYGKSLQDGIPFMGKEWRKFHAHTNTTPSSLKVTILTPVVGILSGYCVVTVSTQAMVCPPGCWFKESMRVTSEAAVKCWDARVQLWGVSVSWHEGAAGHTKLSGGHEWVGTNSCYVTRCLSLRESRALRPRLEGSGIG